MATSPAETLARLKPTYQDVLNAPAHQVAEIINGTLYTHPRPAVPHTRASSVLGRKIGAPYDDEVGGPGGWWIHDEPELHLGDDILVPDLAGWRRERMPELPDTAYVTLAPDWVCEVLSASTRRVDLNGKHPVIPRPAVPGAAGKPWARNGPCEAGARQAPGSGTKRRWHSTGIPSSFESARILSIRTDFGLTHTRTRVDPHRRRCEHMTNWAIDANIIMQQGVRRLLGACVEYTNGRLLVPERALALACTHYQSIARRRARRITDWNATSGTEGQAPANRDELIVARAIAIHQAFANWASTEPQRNDGLWALAPATAESSRIAQRLFVAGIAREGRGTHIEEDAEVAAQALDAGCRWIASHNLDLLQGAPFERWLAAEQAQGRLRTASAPFVCAIDDAIDQMLETESETPIGRETLASLAWEVTRPNNPDAARDTHARLRTIQRFTNALHEGGAVRAARFVNEIMTQGHADPEGIRSTLARRSVRGTIDRTRAAEQRQAHASRAAINAVNIGDYIHGLTRPLRPDNTEGIMQL